MAILQSRIYEPQTLLQLPKPLQLSEVGHGYVTGESTGQEAMTKKRQRAEVTVGVDGEALNIYNVSSAKLVTSYPIPPQDKFTCAPTSNRWAAKASKQAKNIVARYTYASTASTSSTHKLTLYKDQFNPKGDTTADVVTRTISAESPPVFLSTSTCLQPAPIGDTNAAPAPPLFAVSGAGHITCFDGDTLVEKWSTSPQVLMRDLPPECDAIQVETVAIAPSSVVSEGIFSGRKDVHDLLAADFDARQADGDVLVVVTRTTCTQPPLARIHVLAILSKDKQKVLQLSSVPVPLHPAAVPTSSFKVHVHSGTLTVISGETLFTFTIRGAMPTLVSELQVPGLLSATTLSKTSTIVLSHESLQIYNPMFDSWQATVRLAKPASNGCIVGYLKRNTAVLLMVGGALMIAELELAKPAGKRLAEDQFIDALGQGIRRQDTVKKRKLPLLAKGTTTGTLEPGYWETLTQTQEAADKLLAQENWFEFEKLVASQLGILTSNSNGVPHAAKYTFPLWKWPASRFGYKDADRRWILWCISKVFKFTEFVGAGHQTEARLTCQLPDGNLLNYLVDAGHLSLRNVKDAFRDSMSTGLREMQICCALVDELAALDPSFHTLANYIISTKLGITELLSVLRAVMRSMEPPGGEAGALTLDQKQLLNEAAGEDDNSAEACDMEMDMLEAELEMGEEELEGRWARRALALSLVLSKLAAHDASTTVRALRRHLSTKELFSLFAILRAELINGAWTSLYFDSPEFDDETSNPEYQPPPDRSIKVIAELLGRCFDAVGQSGWLLSESDVGTGSDRQTGLIKTLQLEVSVALEGAQSAAYLQGLISELLVYGQRVKKSNAQERPTNPAMQQVEAKAAPELPLGLRPEVDRSNLEYKVPVTGELIERGLRERMFLTHLELPEYRMERIRI